MSNGPDDATKRFSSFEAGFKAYEDGKHRRYGLLFAVNGGAFTVARLFTDQNAVLLLGQLSVSDLGYGMIVFTVAMFVDILMFGVRMREKVGWVFGPAGVVVLFSICLSICAGWYLVARGAPPA